MRRLQSIRNQIAAFLKWMVSHLSLIDIQISNSWCYKNFKRFWSTYWKSVKRPSKRNENAYFERRIIIHQWFYPRSFLLIINSCSFSISDNFHIYMIRSLCNNNCSNRSCINNMIFLVLNSLNYSINMLILLAMVLAIDYSY